MTTQKWPSELLIIRHGQSARNVQKEQAKATGLKTNYSIGVRDQDTPLTAVGTTQAEKTGVWLREQYAFPGNGVDRFIVSPYLRTRQTAERAMWAMGYQPLWTIEERLREIEFGILDGLTPEGIKAKYPEEVARKEREGKYYYRAPGGESRPDVRLRVGMLLGTISREYVGLRVVLFCHSVVVLALRSLLERWGEDEYLQVDKEQDVLNCGVTRYAYDNGKLRLRDYNLIAY